MKVWNSLPAEQPRCLLGILGICCLLLPCHISLRGCPGYETGGGCCVCTSTVAALLKPAPFIQLGRHIPVPLQCKHPRNGVWTTTLLQSSLLHQRFQGENSSELTTGGKCRWMWAGVGEKEASANALVQSWGWSNSAASLANSRKRHDLTLENVLYLVRDRNRLTLRRSPK